MVLKAKALVCWSPGRGTTRYQQAGQLKDRSSWETSPSRQAGPGSRAAFSWEFEDGALAPGYTWSRWLCWARLLSSAVEKQPWDRLPGWMLHLQTRLTLSSSLHEHVCYRNLLNCQRAANWRVEKYIIDSQVVLGVANVHVDAVQRYIIIRRIYFTPTNI